VNLFLLIAFAVGGLLAVVMLLALCASAKCGDGAWRKVCSRCGCSLLEQEKRNGWCCKCGEEPLTVDRLSKLHDQEEGLL
jgi:hypothetical protein